MKKPNLIPVFSLAILLILLLVKLTGAAELSILQIVGFSCLVYGSGTVYNSFGQERRAALFTGTFIFLTGVIFFLSGYFDFPRPYSLVVPSFMFMTGAGFLMLFIDDIYNNVLLIIAAAFLILGVSSVLLMGSVNFTSYFNSLWYVAKRYWLVLVILAGIILIIRLRND